MSKENKYQTKNWCKILIFITQVSKSFPPLIQESPSIINAIQSSKIGYQEGTEYLNQVVSKSNNQKNREPC